MKEWKLQRERERESMQGQEAQERNCKKKKKSIIGIHNSKCDVMDV